MKITSKRASPERLLLAEKRGQRLELDSSIEQALHAYKSAVRTKRRMIIWPRRHNDWRILIYHWRCSRQASSRKVASIAYTIPIIHTLPSSAMFRIHARYFRTMRQKPPTTLDTDVNKNDSRATWPTHDSHTMFGKIYAAGFTLHQPPDTPF